MPRKTTHEYLNDYKERLRTAFGEFTGADKKERDEKRQAVEAILAEPTPSELSEEPEEEEEPAPGDDTLAADDTVGDGN